MPDDSLNSLLHVVGLRLALDVVVTQPYSQVLNVALTQMCYAVCSGQDVVVVDQRATTELTSSVHQRSHERELVWDSLKPIDYVEERLVFVVQGHLGLRGPVSTVPVQCELNQELLDDGVQLVVDHLVVLLLLDGGHWRGRLVTAHTKHLAALW